MLPTPTKPMRTTWLTTICLRLVFCQTAAALQPGAPRALRAAGRWRIAGRSGHGRPTTYAHPAAAGDEVARFQLVLAQSRSRRPQRDQRFSAGEPPIFVYIVIMQLDGRARGQDVLMERRGINRVELTCQLRADPALSMRVDDAKVGVDGCAYDDLSLA